MAEPQNANWILVYDLRRDRPQRDRLASVQEQWEAYRRGQWPVQISEGRISNLFFDINDGRDMFELDEGRRRSVWARQGDDSWYAVGWRAKVEQSIFHAPASAADMPVVTRIWVGARSTPQPSG